MGEKTLSQRLLGHNLRVARKLRGLSQMKLAEQCNLSTNFISELEGGKAWVSPESLDTITSVLGIGPDMLFRPLIPEDTASVDAIVARCIETFQAGTDKTLEQLRQELAKLIR